MTQQGAVVFFDDDAISADLIAFSLEEQGIPFRRVLSFEALRQEASQQDARVALFHCDAPERELLDLLDKLHDAVSWPLPVVLTTRVSDEARLNAAQAKLSAPPILKPYDIRELGRIIAERYQAAMEDRILYGQILELDRLRLENQRMDQERRLLEAVNEELLANRPAPGKESVVFAMDPQLRYLYFTPDHAAGVLRLFGKRLEKGTQLMELGWPPSIQESIRALFPALEGKKAQTTIHLQAEGLTLEIQAVSRPVVDAQGKVFAALIRFEQRFLDVPGAAEAPIRLSWEDTFEHATHVLSHIKNYYILMDADGMVLYVTPNAGRELGWTALQLKGVPVSDMTREGLSLEALAEACSDRGHFIDWKKWDGSAVAMKTQVTRLIDTIGSRPRWLARIHTPDYHEADQLDLTAAQAWNNAPLAMEILDGEGRLVVANRARKALITSLPQPERWALISPAWKGLAKEKTTLGPLHQGKVALNDRGPPLPFLLFELPGEEPGFAVIYASDPRERRAFQTHHGTELINLLAHQWRQPLAQITSELGSIQLNKELGKLEESVWQAKMSSIQDAVHRLSDSLDSLRNYGQKDSRRQKVDLSEAVESALGLLQDIILRRGIRVHHHIPVPPPELLGFQGELFQVVLELFSLAAESFAGQLGEKSLMITYALGPETIGMNFGYNGRPLPADSLEELFQTPAGARDADLVRSFKFIREVVVDHHGGSLNLQQEDNWSRVFLIFPSKEQT